MIRIIAGEFRSRRLHTPPDDEATRPYTQRVKESVFNQLREWFDGARVLDLFAGIGTMGLEAVSRGAEMVLLVERDRKIYELLQRNITELGCEDRAESVLGDALGHSAVARAPAPLDIVFVDPPYRMMRDEAERTRVLEQIQRCRAVMAPSSFVILRSPVGPKDAPLELEGFDGPEVHRYGNAMWVLLYAPQPGADATT